MVKHTRLPFLIFLITVLLAQHLATLPVHAAPLQALSASDVMATVNALRTSQGLAPYSIDSGLMAYAQEHADYMARTGRSSHVHSDGSIPLDRGLQENIANGTAAFMSADFIVYTIWADPVHLHTMTGYAGGAMGVGVASNDQDIYISLDVRPSNAAASSSSASGSNPSAKASPVTLIAPVVTATSQADGSVIHTVGYGQSLWQIAISYGVKMDDIRALNGLPAGSTTIYENQKLLIWPKGSFLATPTILPTATRQAVEKTPTHRPTQVPATPTTPSTPTLTPSPVPTPPPTITANFMTWFNANGRILIIGLVFFSAAALFVVFLWSFRKE